MSEEVKEWEELGRTELCKKYGRGIDLVKFRMPDGVERDFSLITAGRSVAILALTEKNEVILARQFRPGPKKTLLELPGGGADKDEDYEVAAARELLEETGYQAKEVKYVGSSWMTAYSGWKGNICVALDCKKVAEPKLDEGEFVETVLMSLAEFREHIKTGEMTDVANAYMALDYLGRL